MPKQKQVSLCSERVSSLADFALPLPKHSPTAKLAKDLSIYHNPHSLLLSQDDIYTVNISKKNQVHPVSNSIDVGLTTWSDGRVVSEPFFVC